MLPGPRYQFGDFELDTARFELLRKGHNVPLERKPLELLILLAESEGRLVTRTEIAEHLWEKEVFVDTEHGINTAIRKIRAALRDNPEKPRFLQTVTRMGYRFLPPVQIAPGALALPRAAPLVESPNPQPVSPQANSRNTHPGLVISLAALFCAAAALLLFLLVRSRSALPEIRYEQLTDLTDSAVAPALSPDGRFVAFFRSDTGFSTTGPLYIKSLSGGEARLVTSDPRPKYGPAFSPDGSQIAYTVFSQPFFSTYVVSASGGEPRLLLDNAAGLTWLTAKRLLFSRTDGGIHLDVVEGTVDGGPVDNIYSPAHRRGMAHYSRPSPDGEWLLIVEMDASGGWGPCRVVALTGAHQTHTVGPPNGCTAAAWSQDGRWMYFTATLNGRSHIWRQRFPRGAPQQITFGADEEQGLAVEPSGNSLITSVGTGSGALWLKDSSGERQLTSVGDVLSFPFGPVFRRNDNLLFYLSQRSNGGIGAELWRVEPATGKSEVVLPGIPIFDVDVSADGKQVVYSRPLPNGTTELFLAPADREHDPVDLSVPGARFPHFGSMGQILFQQAEGNTNYIEQVRADGSGRSRVVQTPITELQSVSPSGHWAITMLSGGPSIFAVPLKGGASRRLCAGFCTPRWSSDGHFLLIDVDLATSTTPGRSLAIPLGPEETLPELPLAGIRSGTTPADIPGSRWVPSATGIPGRDLASLAIVKRTVQRNLFRLALH